FYTAENLPFGATFTYHLKDALKTLKQTRQETEKEAAKKGERAPYPTPEQLRAEAEEEPPAMLVLISDTAGNVIRTLTGPVTQGFHRVAWNLRAPAPSLPRPRPPDAEDNLFAEEPSGALVLPGRYRVSLAKRVGGVTSSLAGPQEFAVTVDRIATVPRDERLALFEFQQKVGRLQRAVLGALDAANGLTARLEQAKRAIDHTPGVDPRWKDVVRSLEKDNRAILRALRGDTVLRARHE